MIPGVSDITAYFGMAFRKEDASLQAFANEQLAMLKKSGELTKLQEKWFGGTMDTPDVMPEVLP
jgi:polar amino acid transport system substrate-binding protein